jgi:hypothetical protein
MKPQRSRWGRRGVEHGASEGVKKKGSVSGRTCPI